MEMVVVVIYDSRGEGVGALKVEVVICDRAEEAAMVMMVVVD